MLKQFQQELETLQINSALIYSPLNLSYLLEDYVGSNNKIADLSELVGFLKITNDKIIFITDKRFEGIKFKNVKTFVYEKKSKKSYFETLTEGFTTKIGMELSNMLYTDVTKFQKQLRKNKVIIKDISKSINKLRIIKSQKEIKKVKKAQEITDRVFQQLIKLIKAGQSEVEIASKIKMLIFEQGGGLAFEPIVAFGKNSASAHHISNNTKLSEKNNVILLDFGASFEGYNSDMTRTIFLTKPITAVANQYFKVLNCLNKGERMSNKGKSLFAIDSELKKLLKDFGQNSFEFYHSLGHGVGLEVHEAPFFNTSNSKSNKLQQGNIITLEPALYFKNKYGIRIEDLILVDKKGLNLTKSTKELIILN